MTESTMSDKGNLPTTQSAVEMTQTVCSVWKPPASHGYLIVKIGRVQGRSLMQDLLTMRWQLLNFQNSSRAKRELDVCFTLRILGVHSLPRTCLV